MSQLSMYSAIETEDYTDVRYITMESSSQRGRPSLPWWRWTYEIEPLLIRKIYHIAAKYDAIEGRVNGEVNTVLFRRCMRRILDMYGDEIPFDVGRLGSKDNQLSVRWPDVYMELNDPTNPWPTLELSCPQAIFLMLFAEHSSRFAKIWFVFLIVAIIVNVTVIMIKSVEGLSPYHALFCQEAERWTIRVFAIDYFVKAICVMWVPVPFFNEEWALERILPNADQIMELRTTHWQRFWYFASMPSQVIDFASILPVLLQWLFEEAQHLPLSGLRVLRLLRVMRILKAFKALGSWVRELQVLGEAFYSSLGSVFVLLIYIMLFSMIAGAVLQQQEVDGDPAFETVPWSTWYVIARFAGGVHSLPRAQAVASTPISALVIAAMGLFRGVVFLLPIDQLKKATQEAEMRQKEIQDMSKQVTEEADELHRIQLGEGATWAKDPTCPYVRVEVSICDSSGTPMARPAVGAINVPIFLDTPEEATLLLPLHCHVAGLQKLEVHMHWAPLMSAGQMPLGKLRLRPQRGFGFSGWGNQWVCRFLIPVKFYGEGAFEEWFSAASGEASRGEIRWASEGRTFDVHWQQNIKPDAGPRMQSDEDFQRRVLELLEDQNRRIGELEKSISASKTLQNLIA